MQVCQSSSGERIQVTWNRLQRFAVVSYRIGPLLQNKICITTRFVARSVIRVFLDQLRQICSSLRVFLFLCIDIAPKAQRTLIIGLSLQDGHEICKRVVELANLQVCISSIQLRAKIVAFEFQNFRIISDSLVPLFRENIKGRTIAIMNWLFRSELYRLVEVRQS